MWFFVFLLGGGGGGGGVYNTKKNLPVFSSSFILTFVCLKMGISSFFIYQT